MKIGVMSDSHGNTAMVQKVLKRMGRMDMLFHLGDRYGDLWEPGAICLRGNCDFEAEAPLFWSGTVEGVGIYATHGHLYRVKWGTDKLVEAARQNGWRLVLYGHTHIPEHRTIGDIVLVNPGSLSEPRSGAGRTAAVIEITGGKAHVGFITL